MRKRSSYRPKGVRLDNVSWIKAGFKPVGSVPSRRASTREWRDGRVERAA